MKSIITNNLKSKSDAVEYVNDNIENLTLNMTNVAEDVVRSYAEFKEIPISIQAIDEDSFMEHEDKILYILSAIGICQEYLSEIESKLNKYYKPDDYLSKRTEEIQTDIRCHLSDYVDEFSHDIDVKYPDNDSLKHGYMIIDDGKIKQVKTFL